jgi:hypothetical protein
MVRNGYSTKMIFTMVRNGRYGMVMVIHKYMLHVGTVKSMYLKRERKTSEKKYIHVYIHIINFIKCSVISTLFIILFNSIRFCIWYEMIMICRSAYGTKL